MFSLLWDDLILNPMTNALLVLYDVLGNNFFLSIAVFTVATRLVMLPLNIRSQRTTMRMQEMQPQIQAIQKKYRDNPQKMQEEFAKIGYNPAESLSGCLPLLIQMPIFIGLYRAILLIMGATPQDLLELQARVYDAIDLSALLPIENTFLWFNLAQPDPFFVLPVLVGLTMYVSQKLITPQQPKKTDKKGKSEPDNPMAQMTQSMTVTMPLMFGFFSLTFPAGLSLYFVLSNLIGIGQGYLMKRAREQAKVQLDADRVVRNGHEAEEAAEIAADSDKGKRGRDKTDAVAGETPPPSSADRHVTGDAGNGQTEAPRRRKPTSKRKRRRAKR